MKKPNRRRLPMLHWLTAHKQHPDYLNQLAASIFFSLHSTIKHECMCDTHKISVTEEWSYLPTDSLIVMQCKTAAHYAIEHTQKAVGTGWIEPVMGTWCNEKYQFVLPTIRAKEIAEDSSSEFPPSEEDARLIKDLLIEVKSKQSDTWDYVIKDYEANPNKKISCMSSDTRVLFPVMYGGQKYDIITKAGNKYIATVDDSREFSSEGLEWKTESDGNIEQYNIAAWKLIE